MSDFALVHRIAPHRAGPERAPCLLLMHGRGTDEHDLLPLAEALDHRFFAISVRGPLRFPFGGYAWYDLDPSGVGYPERASLQRTLSLLDQFLEQITHAYPIDPARIYATGFSMGAVMSGTLALLWPNRVQGAGILSGYLPLHAGLDLKPAEAAGHPIFQAHGSQDDVIPVSLAREARDYLRTTPVVLTYHEYPMGHQISPAEWADFSPWFSAVLDDASMSRQGTG